MCVCVCVCLLLMVVTTKNQPVVGDRVVAYGLSKDSQHNGMTGEVVPFPTDCGVPNDERMASRCIVQFDDVELGVRALRHTNILKLTETPLAFLGFLNNHGITDEMWKECCPNVDLEEAHQLAWESYLQCRRYMQGPVPCG